MNSKITNAFDCIRAEDDLKEKTLMFLHKEIQKKSNPYSRIFARRFFYAATCSICLFLTGLFSYSFYFTENAYIDLDINPSVEFSINRFDRVIGVYAYNADGENILDGLNVKHKEYNKVLEMLLDAAASKGFMQDDKLISVTLQTNNKEREAELLSNIKTSTEASVHEHHYSASINVFSVNDNIRNNSHELNISPAKYLAILELQEIDPTVTFESCSDHTISEIKDIVQSHGAGHHSDTIIDSKTKNQNHENGNQAEYNSGTEQSNNEDGQLYNNQSKSEEHHGHSGGHD